MVNIEVGDCSSVVPSAGWPLAYWMAIWPPAPVLFSTVTDLAKVPVRRTATRRQVVSEVPPAAKPVTIFMFSIWACAMTCWPRLARKAVAPADWTIWRRDMRMEVSLKNQDEKGDEERRSGCVSQPGHRPGV